MVTCMETVIALTDVEHELLDHLCLVLSTEVLLDTIGFDRSYPDIN